MKKRTLRESEKSLWEKVAQTVSPLRPHAEKPKAKAAAADTAAAPPSEAAHAPAPSPPSPASLPAKSAKTKRKPPSAGEIDRKTRRKISRGTLAIDARIDLHGMTQEEAERALIRFIDSCSGRGLRVVLVITGKGQGGEGRGILRRSVPVWLTRQSLTRHVVSFSPAGPTHGGDGALYVRLRVGGGR
ncbi:Smr/MutS family protein [Acuticoccus sp. M5D2P5]|uniref:Smr/MutS family protein n=1 Tax=Acuticoccus kalidii TaxID=2910977 RepID=UPI001F2815CA|nr:Smr/MutS family protein [Acuticoccus kalidii]MCF3933657.1 Smr/MutS family protein [Acuticoccus kalidii]